MPSENHAGWNPAETMMKTMTEAMRTGQSMSPMSPAMLMAGPAFGLGLAAQGWGTMLGLMQGVAASAGRLPSVDAPFKAPMLFWNEDDEDSQAFGMAMATPMTFLAAATKTVYADMEHTARDVLEVGEHVASDVAGEAGSVARAMETVGGGASAALSAAGGEAQSSVDELMPEDFAQPDAMEKPAQPDDLKMIAGVGPKLEEKLNGLGVWTFAQIAAWTPEEVAWVDDYLAFKGRIARDGWIGQAAALARGGRDEYVEVFGKEPK
ncbi:NADH-ubiquinone dehydrogenase [Zhengella mangrovi]|uniref:NADH-ubiquinone dehydrogenase n=1 Tax=Zhengella mangrovi TaxID=1982044 RepID=UPI00197B52FB|nr:NADH-ubiquinone dehydrogenase [Zhengella mangrovi]